MVFLFKRFIAKSKENYFSQRKGKRLNFSFSEAMQSKNIYNNWMTYFFYKGIKLLFYPSRFAILPKILLLLPHFASVITNNT